MHRHPTPALLALALSILLLSPGQPAQAQDEDRAYDAAVALLTQTTRPTRDGKHNQLLLALRHLRDPDLRPFFEALSVSPYAPQRVHGHLGLAEVSPAQRIALATIAEIENTDEMVELLGVAIDDDLLDAATLSQVLTWEGLDEASKLALAVRVAAGGVAVDDALLREALWHAEEPPDLGELLRHGLAALLLHERGDPAARVELDRLSELGTPRDRDVVRAQILEVGHRHDFQAVAPWALSLAQDESADPRLRLLALRAALRFLARGQRPEVIALWEQLYTEADGQAQRVRLAIIALEASPWADPALYRLLVNHDDTYLRLIGEAGHAVSSSDPQADAAIVRLVEYRHPLTVQWATRYARDFPGPERHHVLLAVIDGYDQGPDRSRDQLATYAVDAAQALVEQDPLAAREHLLPILRDPQAIGRRGEVSRVHLILLGLVRAHGVDLSAFSAALPDHADPDAQDMTLLLRAREGTALDNAQWERVAQVVVGLSVLDDSLRIQLAWFYLKRIGKADDAFRDATARRD